MAPLSVYIFLLHHYIYIKIYRLGGAYLANHSVVGSVKILLNSRGLYLANHSIRCHLDRLPAQRFQEGVWLEEELLLSCVFNWHKSVINCFHSEQTSLQ